MLQCSLSAWNKMPRNSIAAVYRLTQTESGYLSLFATTTADLSVVKRLGSSMGSFSDRVVNCDSSGCDTNLTHLLWRIWMPQI